MKKILKNLFNAYFLRKYYMSGMTHILKMRQHYKKITKLSEIEYKIFSQNGEDGIIDFIMTQLNIEKPKFIEIGVGDYSESNTKFLFERTSAKGLIIDCIDDFKVKVSKNTKLWKGDLEVIEKKIDTTNIIELLKSKNFLDELDFFSLDIDGADYWILNEMPYNFAKVAILEYNPTFGNKLNVTVPNIDNFNRTSYHYSNLCFGMSLRAAVEMMKSKNFYFLGVNLMRNNVFFVSNDYPKQKFFKNLEIDNPNIVSDSNFRESRDIKGKLNFLSGKNKIKEISECEVVDLNKNKTTKLKKLFDENFI
jgi:hypothetical protein